MIDKRNSVVYRGDVNLRNQIDTATIGGTIETGDIFTVTIHDASVSVAAGEGEDEDDVSAALAAAINESTAPEFTQLTAAAAESGGVLTLTADEANVPFVATYTTTEANGDAADDQTFVGGTTHGTSTIFRGKV